MYLFIKHVNHGERMNPIDFGGYRSKVKVTMGIIESCGVCGDATLCVVIFCLCILNPFQIWCAAGVALTGGKTRDGGSVVGASVFYSSPPESETNPRVDSKDEVEKLNQELKVKRGTGGQ